MSNHTSKSRPLMSKALPTSVEVNPDAAGGPFLPTDADRELDEQLALAEYRREQADWQVES